MSAPCLTSSTCASPRRWPWSNMLFLVVVALNTLLGIVQEVHAKRLVEKLSLLSLPTARVIRDGGPAEIPTQDLVEEDVIELETGRQVCADAIIPVSYTHLDVYKRQTLPFFLQ